MKTVYTGTFLAHPKGFGFVRVEGLEEDIFIHGKRRHHAFHEDLVEVRILPDDPPERKGRGKGKKNLHHQAQTEKKGRKRLEGEVMRVLSHHITAVVGTYFSAGKKGGFLLSDNQRLPEQFKVPKGMAGRAKSGDKAVLEITDYGAGRLPEGRISEILGMEGEPGVDILSIARSMGLHTDFPEKVIAQADRLNRPVTSMDISGRRDFRDLLTITIDGEHSRDFDDAVSLEPLGEDYLLGVHIADVSNYVQEGSALDIEAKKRGNSAYLINVVLPMLPESLSNGICSLNQGEDRLTLSCVMRVSREGEITDHEICESVIRSSHRMTYTEVQRLLTDKKAAKECEPELLQLLKGLHKVSKAIRRNRIRRGAIDFDFPESEITLDDKGQPVSIQARQANDATRLIEDCMLSANETVARHFSALGIPMIYRNHGLPDPERVAELLELLRSLGVSFRASKAGITPRDVQRLLKKVKGRPEEALVSMLTLRSMQRAAYGEKNAGHFGLAAPYYLHFTSPIRRYPDLLVHRIIRHVLRGRMNEDRRVHYEDLLHGTAEHCSVTERAAEEAERECEKLKKAEYIGEHLGEVFSGRVSGMLENGFYVELPNTIEGYVPILSMEDDRYVFLKESYEIRGERTGTAIRIGDEVSVMAVSVNPFARTIDFALVREKTPEEKTHRAGRHGSTKARRGKPAVS